MNKPTNWFSRRHQTGEAHSNAVATRISREMDYFDSIEERIKARASRSANEQLKTLDSILGKNVGAKKERARLYLEIERKKSGKTNGKKNRKAKK